MKITPKGVAIGEAFISLFLRLRAKGIDNSRIFSALEQTPRQHFLDPVYAAFALDNCIIPISCGEYIERLDEQIILISSLQLEKKHRVLEIGTGSGFTAALMARLAGRITSIERYKTLCEHARRCFQILNVDNVILRQADAYCSIVESGPFDRIVIWPSQPNEPQPFIELLASNGILVAPIGPTNSIQTIVRYSRVGGCFERTDMFRVRYQPFIKGIAAAL
ncbi:MAG: protein-L-isoaspartate(D-aspartate) O-methyltransferase [Candidatus Tokpelaia sp. JSC188]|nr:MAG: protein-L-isoaspartate(D-aspartate) O-methyltransferase [Candidatus Tokpelaia sp. JSC188]